VSQTPLAPARRVLGFWSLLALGLNGIIGVGIFFAPSEIAKQVPGPASALVFVATAALLLPVAWTYGRLGSAFAEDGGPYVWAREALGEHVAFAVGIIAYASAVLSTSAIVMGLGQYLAPELGVRSPQARWAFEIAMALGFSAIARFGLRPSAWLWSVLTVLKLLPLLYLAGFGAMQVTVHAQEPVWSLDAEGLGRAALWAVFPLQGFEIVAVPAGEARGGKRTVLLATLLSMGIAALLYALLQSACVFALPELANVSAPIVEAGSLYSDGRGRGLFLAGANVSAIGIAFGMFAMTPRYLAALGSPSLLGSALSRERRGVPRLALAITTCGVVTLLSSSSFSGLFVLSSLAVLAQFAVSAVSLFLLARRRERGLSAIDQCLAPFTLLAILALLRSAKLAELGILLGIVLGGFGLRHVRQVLARRRSAR
jgi:basic amino acid/polyamine antiporter, APA family